MVKVVDERGRQVTAEYTVDGKGNHHAPGVVILPPGPHVLEARRPIRCTSEADKQHQRSIIKVNCRGGSIKKRVLVVAGKTLTVILGDEALSPEALTAPPQGGALRPDSGPASRGGALPGSGGGQPRYVGDGTASF